MIIASDDCDVLATLREPTDIQQLSTEQLVTLAADIRGRIIDVVTGTGGHLGASLGTVELTVALHRVFTSPSDIVIFDTGHQAYTHKLLTGRDSQFPTLRQADGISGYPCRAESVHDWVENSHASVSLAWADGIAKAFALQQHNDRRMVAVIGDGALTGGVAWEALNNLGDSKRPVVIVLNDNGRAYDPTTGAFATHLRRLRAGSWEGPNLFETLGFAYIGPVDGHDIDATSRALEQAAGLGQPVIVHALTVKGRGYAPAEADEADRMHACGVLNSATGKPLSVPPPSWSDVFEHEIVAIAHDHPEVVAMTAAMRLPTGLGEFSQAFPERFFDSGMAEQHLLASASGLAMGGAHPVVAIYSTFLCRAFDQLLFDVGLHQLPVTLVLDRAGVTGPDGPSHHGTWDLSLLRCVPGLRIACPRDALRLGQQLREAIGAAGPTALRYPKGAPGEDIPAVEKLGGIDVLHRTTGRAREVLLVGIGPMARTCLSAAAELERDGIGVTVVDPQWVWPLPPGLLELSAEHRITVCVEDGLGETGIGSHLVNELHRQVARAHCCALGLPSSYLEQGNRNDLLARYGLSSRAISTRCRALLDAANLDQFERNDMTYVGLPTSGIAERQSQGSSQPDGSDANGLPAECEPLAWNR